MATAPAETTDGALRADVHDDEENDENGNEPLGMADAMMMRGSKLRLLRKLMEEAETLEEEEITGDALEDQFDVLSTGQRVLRYESYLKHQRYYDDMKHVNYDFIDYGRIITTIATGSRRPLIIEQDKSLGKGGLCWDAAFILAEHVIDTKATQEWIEKEQGRSCLRMVELGSGTGLCGMMIASVFDHQDCVVEVTDLPKLMPLMRRNLELNFGGKGTDSVGSGTSRLSTEDLSLLFGMDDNGTSSLTGTPTDKLKSSSCTARVLRWGCVEDYGDEPYDVLIGADLVASLYDPVALARTMWSLTHTTSVVFVSYKGRLSGPHEVFERELHRLFDSIQRIRPTASRNRNPGVWFLRLTGRRAESPRD